MFLSFSTFSKVSYNLNSVGRFIEVFCFINDQDSFSESIRPDTQKPC